MATVTTQQEAMEVEEEFSAPVVEAASSPGNAGSSSACDDAPQEQSDVVRLQREIELIKDDDSAILCYSGFPNYRSLIGFYNFIEPKLQKMQSGKVKS